MTPPVPRLPRRVALLNATAFLADNYARSPYRVEIHRTHLLGYLDGHRVQHGPVRCRIR